jgi:hypothetical protein
MLGRGLLLNQNYPEVMGKTAKVRIGTSHLLLATMSTLIETHSGNSSV